MLYVENTEVMNWKAAIRGMRNPLESWKKSDTRYLQNNTIVLLGDNDFNLMRRLIDAGPDECKFMRMIAVSMDITAPLYWWKEFDTYKVGTVANSCSTMHKIHAHEFTEDMFSCENLIDERDKDMMFLKDFRYTLGALNLARTSFLATKDRKYWDQMIQLLPTSFNQKRTVTLNYAVLRNMYHARKNHKLNEWHQFCDWIKTLPYYELITD